METTIIQTEISPLDLPKDEKVLLAVELRAMQWSFRSIACHLGITHPTAKRWIEDEHARRSEHRGIDKESHLAVYDVIQKKAWVAFEEKNNPKYLNIIRAAEDSKTKITGAEAPRKYQHVDDTFEIVFDDSSADDDAYAEFQAER